MQDSSEAKHKIAPGLPKYQSWSCKELEVGPHEGDFVEEYLDQNSNVNWWWRYNGGVMGKLIKSTQKCSLTSKKEKARRGKQALLHLTTFIHFRLVF